MNASWRFKGRVFGLGATFLLGGTEGGVLNSGSDDDDRTAVLCDGGGRRWGYLFPVTGEGGWMWVVCEVSRVGGVCGCVVVGIPAGELWVEWRGESEWAEV